MNSRHLILSLCIVAVLLMQAAAYFVPRQSQVYPFIDYPMYRASYGPPIEVGTTKMVAVLEDGREVDVTAAYMGLRLFAWRDLHVKRILMPDVEGPMAEQVRQDRDEARQRVVRCVETREGQRVAKLRFDEHVYALTDQGLRERDEAQVVAVVEADHVP